MSQLNRLFPRLMLLLSLALAACGPTRANTIEEYTEPFAEKREQLIRISASLPPVGTVSSATTCPVMDPPLRITAQGVDELPSNGVMLMDEIMLNPDLDIFSEVIFDVGIDDHFVTALKWTGPNNPMSKTILHERSNSFVEELEAALALDYLIVNRIDEYEPATIIEEDKQFLPGYVSIEGFIIDFESEAILCQYRVEAVTTADLVTFNENYHTDGRGDESALQWALEVDVRHKLQALLNEMTNGTIAYSSIQLKRSNE